MSNLITCLWFDHGEAPGSGKTGDGGDDDNEPDRHRRDRGSARGRMSGLWSDA